MSSYSPNMPDHGSAPVSDDFDTINLRPLLDLFMLWWRETILLTVVAAAVGSGIFYLRRLQEPLLYQASAQVAITRITSNVIIDSNFKTAIENNPGNSSDSIARRNSLLGLVKSGSIAQAVLDELGPMLEGTTAPALLRQVSAAFAGENTSDLIAITVRDESPEVAAAIANAWAKHYVGHINILFGEMPAEMGELVANELETTRTNYNIAQQAYEEFLRQNDVPTLNRQVREKEEFINTLQNTRQIALHTIISQTLQSRQKIISTYQDAVQQNQLLALTSEQEANRALLETLITTISANRQLAITTEQAARQQIFTEYAERELQNRLLGIQQEQDAKTAIFKAYSSADLEAKLAVFNQQAGQKVAELIDAYATQRRIDQLLDEAEALQAQIEASGDAGARTNSLPLLLLKIDAFAVTASPLVTGGTSSSDLLQLNVAGDGTLDNDTTNQAADIAALIDNLTARAAALRQEIETRSVALYNNEGYALLDGVRPEDDALYAAIQEQYLALFEVDALGGAGDPVWSDPVADDTRLSQAILAKYEELFSVGTLANAGLTISTTTPIYTALHTEYPALFTVGDLTQLSDLLATDSALDSASQEKLLELLQPLVDIERYRVALENTSQPILQLEEELRTLQATLENKRAQSERLVRERDMALETYTALNNKRLELSLQRTVAGREVGLASLATPPDRPVAKTSMLLVGAGFGIGSFVFALIIILLSSYMDARPFLSRMRPAPVRPVNQALR